MKLKGVKGFGLGKAKDKNDAISVSENTDSIKVMGLKEKLNNRTKGLEEKEQELNNLITGSGMEETRPHGPIEELSLETGELGRDEEIDDDIDDITQAGNEPVIKVVQMSKISEEKPEAPPNPEGAGSNGFKQPDTAATPANDAELKSEAADDSLSNLFSSDEEEVNPLANLINALPDVTAQELVDDLSEIKGIINEWQKG